MIQNLVNSKKNITFAKYYSMKHLRDYETEKTYPHSTAADNLYQHH